jgi:hypothetical protein
MTFELDFPIESETDVTFAIAAVLNEAEENGVDAEAARDAALGYVKGRQVGGDE